MKSNVSITKIQLTASPKKVEAAAPVPSDTTAPVENADANPNEVEPAPQKEADADMVACSHCNGSGKVASDYDHEDTPKPTKADDDSEDMEAKADDGDAIIDKVEKGKSPVAKAEATPVKIEHVDPYAKGKQLKHSNTGRFFNKSLPISERQKAFADKMSKAFPLDEYEKQIGEWKKKNNL